MRLTLAGAGNADTNVNLINPRFQAEALRQLRGIDCGVLDNSFYTSAAADGSSRTDNAAFQWQLSCTNVQNITIGRGMATAYGYDLQSEDDVVLHGNAGSGTTYLFVYLEWDLSNPEEALGSILLRYNGSSATWNPQYQDNLITNPIGKYQMPLWRIACNSTGAVISTTKWTALGVQTITHPLRAQHAAHAERADYAGNNTTAGTIDSRLNEVNVRLDVLGFRTAVIENPNVSYINTAQTELHSLGKIIYGFLRFTIPSGVVTELLIGTVTGIFLPSTSLTLVDEVNEDETTHGTIRGRVRIILNADGKIVCTTSGSSQMFEGTYGGLYVFDGLNNRWYAQGV